MIIIIAVIKCWVENTYLIHSVTMAKFVNNFHFEIDLIRKWI